MKKLLLATVLLLAAVHAVWSQKADDAILEAKMKHLMDSISSSYQYQTGQVTIGENLATLQVPPGFRYLNPAQSKQVLEDLWGNPPGQTSLGMIFPEKLGPLDSSSFAFNLTYEDMGYVKDGDADDINYDDLLKNMKKDSEEENKARAKEGYEPISIIGWASQPFYDKDKKILHWAKEFKVGDYPENTLNYDVRVLGRKGVLSMNAIGLMSQLALIKSSIPAITGAVAYTDGNKYSDFSKSSGDKIAAWTIGGLVAGKILAKAGLFAILAKFAKLIIAALLAGGAGIWRFITGRRKESEEATAFETYSSAPPTTPEEGSEQL
ncbi:MAG: DUF2167 domain-containing protein [Bacteroidota bacterium]